MSCKCTHSYFKTTHKLDRLGKYCKNNVPELGIPWCLSEKEMATHSSVLAWRIPGTEEPVRLQPQGWQELEMMQQQNRHQCGLVWGDLAHQQLDQVVCSSNAFLYVSLCGKSDSSPINLSFPAGHILGYFQSRGRRQTRMPTNQNSCLNFFKTHLEQVREWCLHL